MASKNIKLPPVHPGEILREDFLKPLELSINALARGLHVPANHVSGIVNEKRGISGVMARRPTRYFGTSQEPWLGLQKDYELDLGERVPTSSTDSNPPGEARWDASFPPKAPRTSYAVRYNRSVCHPLHY